MGQGFEKQQTRSDFFISFVKTERDKNIGQKSVQIKKTSELEIISPKNFQSNNFLNLNFGQGRKAKKMTKKKDKKKGKKKVEIHISIQTTRDGKECNLDLRERRKINVEVYTYKD